MQWLRSYSWGTRSRRSDDEVKRNTTRGETMIGGGGTKKAINSPLRHIITTNSAARVTPPEISDGVSYNKMVVA